MLEADAMERMQPVVQATRKRGREVSSADAGAGASAKRSLRPSPSVSPSPSPPRSGNGKPWSQRSKESLSSAWSALYRAAWVFALEDRLDAAKAKLQALVQEQSRCGRDSEDHRHSERIVSWLVQEIEYLRRTKHIASREAGYFGIAMQSEGGDAGGDAHPQAPSSQERDDSHWPTYRSGR